MLLTRDSDCGHGTRLPAKESVNFRRWNDRRTAPGWAMAGERRGHGDTHERDKCQITFTGEQYGAGCVESGTELLISCRGSKQTTNPPETKVREGSLPRTRLDTLSTYHQPRASSVCPLFLRPVIIQLNSRRVLPRKISSTRRVSLYV